MRTPEQIKAAQRWAQNAWRARRRLLDRGDITEADVQFMDTFDAKAMDQWLTASKDGQQ